MTSSDDPFAQLPVAVAGLIVGIGLLMGCGYGLVGRWVGESLSRTDRHDTLEGRIEAAGWRPSAAEGGPNWYLQIRLVGDDRRFLVAASALSSARRERLGIPAPIGSRAPRSIPSLEGRSAALVVDSGLDPSNPTPYLSALRVDGERVLPLEGRTGSAPPLWQRIVVWGVLGLGALTGVGLVGVSGHHVLLCLRHRRG